MKDKEINDLEPKLRESYIDSLRCVSGIYDFSSALLFSMETMATIGFGTRSVRSGCTWGTIILMMESIVGFLLPILWTAIVVAKFKHKAGKTSVRFSHYAAIIREKGKFSICLMFTFISL